jgi:hypothetical protein
MTTFLSLRSILLSCEIITTSELTTPFTLHAELEHLYLIEPH